MDPYFFYTAPYTNYKYLCILDSEKRAYTKHLYFPSKFEKLSNKQIETYQSRLVARFLWFTIFNKNKFYNPYDYRIAVSRIFDLNSQTLLMSFSGMLLYKVLSNFEAPFLELAINDYMTLATFRKSIVFTGVLCGIYYLWKNSFKQNYLFDLALKYKEEFATGELVSPNCEGVFLDARNKEREKCVKK